jgi:hypothetical protein
MFSQLENHQNDEIRSLMIFINDSFVGLGFSASESGSADSRATKFRLGAKDVGHGVITETEDRILNSATEETPQELARRLSAVLGKNIKKLQ